jgi:cytoskeletal protein CcmA (bactofilin family)
MMTTAPDDAGEGFSVIDRHSTFDGNFVSKRDLRIEGEVKGTIECSGTLFIAQGATVNAAVEAENISVAGDFTGEVNCRGRLQVMPSGRLRGKVATKSLVINEGAFYEGNMEMANPNAPVEQPRVQAPVTTPRPLPTASTQAPPQRPQQQAAPVQPPVQNAPAPQIAQPGQSDPSSRTFIRRFGGPETAWDAGAEDALEPPSDTPDSEQA